jgi:hypothetical protein
MARESLVRIRIGLIPKEAKKFFQNRKWLFQIEKNARVKKFALGGLLFLICGIILPTSIDNSPCQKITHYLREGLMRLRYLFLAMVALPCQMAWPQETVPDTLNGKFLYDDYAGCASCHGFDGKGKAEGVTLEPPPPDFTDCSFNSREPRKDWHAVITRGGSARGLSMSMPSYGEILTNEQIAAIIDYIKTLCVERDWPQGEPNFRRPQITSKAFPENEALLIPQYTHHRNKSAVTKFVYERRFGNRGHWEVAVPHAKGFHSFFIQSSLKYEKPLREKDGEDELLFNLAFTLPLTKEKQGLFPMLELNGTTALESGETNLFLTPQLYIGLVKRGHIAFSFGGQIPVAGARPFDYRLVSFLLWEYADGGLWW